MKNTIRQSETVKLEELRNLFIELTAKNCNQKCKHCYINFHQYKKINDFIKIDTITQTLNTLDNYNINCIYLTGAEPMTHPDFNAILRLCLKKTNVCICTNGSFINEKKARFLKKVENESNHEIFFEISLDHYDEIKNDDIRYRGAYRHAIFAIKHLYKYDFTPIIHAVNYYNEDYNDLYTNLFNLFSEHGYEIYPTQIKITPYYNKEATEDSSPADYTHKPHPDCRFGRVLTNKGIYACPFLSGDYRGRCGSSIENCATKIAMESDFCQTCMKSKYEIFAISPINV